MKLPRQLLRRLCSRRVTACFLTYLLLFNLCLPAAWSGPEGAQVVNGEVSIQQSAYNTTITASDKAIINYSSFDIARPETVQFIQPSSSASVLNRILSANPTNIDGTLLANGRVFFVNPAGVYIGDGARINVNQLAASALNISNSDFINGRYDFTGGNGAVVNRGDISAEQVYLIGKQVINSGTISCPAGYVVMAAGDRVFMGEPGSEIVLEMDASSFPESADTEGSGTGVLNEGTVEAAGGIIALAAAGDIYSQAISNVGSISTSTETGKAGDISLAAAGGEVINTGTIEASGAEGGQIMMKGARVGQFGTVHADGTVGDGGNVDLTASNVVALGPGSLTTANAGTNGEGGDVVVYSPDTVLFRNGARIEAKGGSESGNGGFIEVSGKNHVEVFGTADASAANGVGGLFFIDPYDITIQAAAGTLDGLTPNFVAGAADSTIGEAAIETQLNSGTSVLIRTADGVEPTQTGLITQNVQIDKSAGGNATITYDAAGDIVLNSGISSTAGQLNVVMQANSTTGGTPTGTGSVDISAAITTNGGNFTSSGVNFDNTGGTITTAGGDVTLTHTGAVTIGAKIDTGTMGGGGQIGISGASIGLGSTVNVISAGTGDVSLHAPSGSITAGSNVDGEIRTDGSVYLESRIIGDTTGNRQLDLDGATALEIADTGAGDIVIRELNASTIASTAITVADAASGNIDITYNNGNSVDINNGHVLNDIDLDQSVSSFSYTATTGDVKIGAINAGTEDATIAATAGAITDDTGPEASNITASSVVLTASTGIGGAGNADIDTAVGTLTAHVTGIGSIFVEDSDGITVADADTANGAITVSAGGLLTAADVQAAGLSGDVTLTTSAGGMDLQLMTAGHDITAVADAGDMEVGSLSAGNAIQLAANTALNQKITDLDDNSNLQALTAALTARAGIGNATHHVGTDVATLNAHVTEAGSIYIDETDAVSLADVDTLAGDIVMTAGGSINGASVIATDGSVNLSADGLLTTVDVRAVDSGSTGNYDVTLATSASGMDLQSVSADHNITATATAGNIEVDSLSAGDLVQLTANTASGQRITDVDDNSDLQAQTATLTARAGIGEAIHDISTAVDTLNGHVTDMGGIYVQELDGIALADVDTADGAIAIAAAGPLSAADVEAAGPSGNVALTTSAGGMDLQLVTAGHDIAAVAAAGDIEVGSLSAGNAIQLVANTAPNQKITDLDDDSNLQALTAALTARAGIGNATHHVGTDVATLNAHVTGAGDIYVDEASSINLADVDTLAGDIVMTAGGSINGASVIATDGAVNLSADGLLTAVDVRAVDSGSTGNYDVTLAASAGGMNLQAVSADRDITATATAGNIALTTLTAGNAISLEATMGTITQSALGLITANGGSLTMKSHGDLNMVNYTVANRAGTDLTLDSTGGSVISTAADEWQSIAATASSNITLSGTSATREITTGALISSTGNISVRSTNSNLNVTDAVNAALGGVSLIADNGKIYTSGDTLNVPITGYSAPGTGVDLLISGAGRGAIVIMSAEDLILGPDATLTANGIYNPVAVGDDRAALDFAIGTVDAGDAIDVAIYLRSYRPGSSPAAGNVSVNSTVIIEDNATVAVDSGDTVTLGGKFYDSLFNQSNRLEVVSRRSTTLNEVITYNRLPYADDPEAIRTAFQAGGGSLTGAYVLRGVRTLLAEILGLTNPVPLAPPRPLEPEVGGEVEGPDTRALEELLNELGIGVQPYVTEAYASSLSTDLRLYSAAEKLQQLIPILEDADGTRIAGLRASVTQFFPSLDVLSEEKVYSFAQELARHKGDGTDYDSAGQCIAALVEYVNILGNDIGWPVDKSVGFVMGRYVPRLTEGDEIRIAVIQMQLQRASGV